MGSLFCFTRKFILLFLASGCSAYLSGQNLEKSSWVRIILERKDGSKIIDRGSQTVEIRYLDFKENKVSYAYSSGIEPKTIPYRIADSRLIFANGTKYDLEYANDTLLALARVHPTPLPFDKSTRAIFINSKFYLKYIKDSNLIPLDSDTIQANQYLYPLRKGLNFFLRENYGFVHNKGDVFGTFVITPEGKLTSARITETSELPQEKQNKLLVLLEGSGKWEVPYNLNKSFKCRFRCQFITNRFYTGLYFGLISDTMRRTNFVRSLTIAEAKTVRYSFANGIRFADNNKLDKALVEFSRCIMADSLCFDAYYNKAAIYYKIKSISQACKEWKILKDLGQKQGEQLYLRNCQ